MPNDSLSPDTDEIELSRVRDRDFKLVYCNWVQAGRTPWDIALVFGRVQEVEPGETAVVEQVTVVLAPALAKAVINTLAITMRDYERDNGEVPIPASLRRLAQERKERTSPSSSPSASLSPSSSASPSPENEGEDEN